MDKDNPTPENNNDSGDKGQEDNKPVTFTQEQVNEIVSKRLAEANTKAEKKLKEVSDPKYPDTLVGTIGCDLLRPLPDDDN